MESIPIPSTSHPEPLHLFKQNCLTYWRAWIWIFQTLQLTDFFNILLQLHIFKSSFWSFSTQLWLTFTSPLQIVNMSMHTFYKCRDIVSPLEPDGNVIGFACHPDLFETNICCATTGLCHLQQVQDAEFPLALHYIQYIAEVPLNSMTTHDEDDYTDNEELLQMIICMSRESSQKLLAVQYLQSDIAFKRVAGFLEFEISNLNQDTKISKFNVTLFDEH